MTEYLISYYIFLFLQTVSLRFYIKKTLSRVFLSGDKSNTEGSLNTLSHPDHTPLSSPPTDALPNVLPTEQTCPSHAKENKEL